MGQVHGWALQSEMRMDLRAELALTASALVAALVVGEWNSSLATSSG